MVKLLSIKTAYDFAKPLEFIQEVPVAQNATWAEGIETNFIAFGLLIVLRMNGSDPESAPHIEILLCP